MSDNEIEVISHQASSQTSQKVSESELMFLILKYLQSDESLSDVTTLLEQRLITSKKFGKVICWDGSSKSLNLQDFQRKFPLITQNHLPLLLLKTIPTAQSLPSGSSLLRSITGFYNPSSQEQFDLFKGKSSQFSMVCGRLRENRRKLDFLLSKLTILTSPQRQKSLQPAAFQQILLSDGDIDLTAVLEYENSNPDWRSNHLVLHQADISRQIQKITVEIPQVEYAIKEDEINKSTTIEELRDAGCLLSGRFRGNLDSGLDYLTQRLYSNGQWHSNNNRYLASSHQYFQRRLLTNYKRLYTISGHSYNPVYCSVFDLTGNFLITGADDYLVKMWDVNKGQLIRTCRGHKNYITLIAVSSDNSMFASACTGGVIRVWRMQDGLCLLVVHHNAPVNWLKFDPSTGCLASASDDGFTIVWDLLRLIDEERCYSPLLKTLRHQNQQASIVPHSSSFDGLGETVEPINQNSSSSASVPSSSFASFPVHSNNVVDNGLDDFQKCIIGLPHLQDSSISSVQGEPRKVLSLDVSPLGNIIVTGCDDGVVRVWRYGFSATGAITTSKYNTRGPNKEMRLDLIRMKNHLSRDDYIKYERIVNHLLLRLEGHVSPVTDIQINSLGDRVLTASTMDGSVRIWSLNSDYSDSVHIILDLADEDEDQINRAAPIRIRGRGAHSRQRSQIHVFNVTWTCDDLQVITIQSVPNLNSSSVNSTNATRLKVWDSVTGDLLRVIKNISDTASRCICRHPKDPKIIVTAGEDGIVNVWNTDEELNLHNFKLSIESIENPGTFMAANVVDLSFTPDGTRLVATDFFGRLTVFGLDDPKRFDAVLSDQYFSSDYAEIMHDDEGNALDVGTQLPVHLSPVGILTRIDGAPHDVTPKITTYPEAFSVNSVLEQLRSIEEENKMVWRERDRVFRLFLRNKESGRSSGPGGASSFRNRRKNRESPKCTGPGNLLSTKTGNIKPFQPLRPRKINYIEFDVDQYQPSSDEEAADSDWDGKSDQAEEVDEDSLDSQEGSIDDDDSRIRVSRRKKGRKLNERSSDLRRSSRHRTHVESYDDAIGNGENDSGSEVFFAPSSRTNRANARRGRKKSAPQGMDDIDNANEIISSNEFSTPFWDEDYVEEEADKEDEGNFEHSQNKKKRGRPAKNGGGKPAKEKNGNKTKRTKRVADEKVSEFDFGISIDRSWLQGDSQLECIYIPQIGDRVIYFPQGHREHLQFFTEDVSPPWNSFPQKWPLVECIIRHIEYRFPGDQELRWTASTVAEITLAITGTPSRNVFTASGQYHVTFVPPRSTRNNTREQLIKVTMRNSQLPDFLVLSDVFMKTIRVAWHQGVLISVQYKEHNEAGEIIFKEYKGKVVSLSNCDPDWPQSPWEALEVSWEDTSDVVDRISPWEAKAVHSSVVSTQTNSNSQINEADSQKAADEINGLIEKHADYEAFHYEVDSRVYPDYYSFIALPIYVDLIVRRLQNQYYRQVESLQFDINQMFENCKQYNSDLSEIVKVASNLRDEMLKIVLLAINHDSFADDNPKEGSATANAHTSSDIGRGRRSRELGDSLIITGAPVSQVKAETGYNEDDEPLVISFKRKRGESLSSKAPEESVDYFEDNLSDPSSNDYFPKKKASRLQRSSSPVQEIMKRGKSSRLKDLNDENEEDPKSLRISLKSRKTELKTKGSNYRRKNGRRKEENESEDESETSDKQSESNYSTDENESEEDNYDFDSNSSVSEKPSRGKNSGKKAQRKGKRITSSSRKTNESTSYSTRGRKASKFNQHDSDVEEEASNEEDDGSDSPPVRRSNRGRGREPVSTTTRVTRRTKNALTHEEDDEEESNEEDDGSDSPPVRRSNRGRGKEPVSTSARVTRRTKKDDEEDDEEESNEEDDGSDSPPVRRSNRGRGREPATTSVRVTRRTKNALTHEEEEDDEEESGNVRRSSRSRKTIKSYNEDDSEAEESIEVHPERNGRQRRKVSVKAEEYGGKQDKRRTSNRSSHRQIELEETNNRNYSSHSGRRMDPEIKKTFQAIVSYAEKLDEEYRFFAEPVDVDVAIGYYEIISIPMDLSTVRSKLSSREYVEYREMIDDILLIYDNCILYNRDDSIYTKEAKRQRKKFIGFVSTELKIEW